MNLLALTAHTKHSSSSADSTGRHVGLPGPPAAGPDGSAALPSPPRCPGDGPACCVASGALGWTQEGEVGGGGSGGSQV